MATLKKIILSVICGFIILVITWKYQNYDYTLSIEDAFFKKIFFIKDKIYSPEPKNKAHFVFINTGKDLSLVEDSVDYGNVAISDREKIYKLLKFINTLKIKPAYTVVDIQFYYPFTVNPGIDSLLEKEIAKNDHLLIPILKSADGKYKPPLYKAEYGYSDYRTFSATFNKFRIMNQEKVHSIPIVLDEKVNGARYHDSYFYPTCNDSLCLSAVWPSYYLKDANVNAVKNEEDIKNIQNDRPIVNSKKIPTEYYNIGEMLFDLEANPENYTMAFGNKILIIGNFQEDIHVTPVGKMSGPVLLANIYLTLLNRQHMVHRWFLVLLLASFSGLSYVALFKKMPEINLNFKFLFSSYLTKFIKGYFSYFGAMFLLSVLALFLFNVQVGLFLPSLIFTGIEYVKAKKYMELKK
jgi:hypothetical protein